MPQTQCTKAIAEICPFTLPSYPVTCIIRYARVGAVRKRMTNRMEGEAIRQSGEAVWESRQASVMSRQAVS